MKKKENSSMTKSVQFWVNEFTRFQQRFFCIRFSVTVFSSREFMRKAEKWYFIKLAHLNPRKELACFRNGFRLFFSQM